ncbi:hypothetical protein Q4610_07715 [Sphingobium sp. HBC34]|uniref:Uncharacterized protein n=1 Tax=Sphingobium cyanobacteriorum TaxID=3063954 RepID=A0ABT8ZKQ3_9SPHN|nr:hypothetical protein [Sphingobium sp. HBC34]MDO7834933.1 hypothetical protein [Sphingobium sp. HBC34]
MRAALRRLVEARAATRRAAIAAALAERGVMASVEGEAVRASGRGLVARWWRDLALREAGRDRR